MHPVICLGGQGSDRPAFDDALAGAGLSALWAADAGAALRELRRRDMPVIVDLSHEPDTTDALNEALALRKQHAPTLMFAVVDTRRPETTIQALAVGAADVFSRPLCGRRVAAALAREQSLAGAGASGPGSELQSDHLYTHSAAMARVAAAIARAAAHRTGVVIRGEDGTGRRVAARAVHEQQTASGAFTVVDCAALPADALELRLFGTREKEEVESPLQLERLTGAGLLAGPAGGSVYLQNIGAAPRRAQGRLARILRDREAVLNHGDTVPLDVRVMAGVDGGIDTAVQEGVVRGDLFRRLSATQIELPALRDRREDIPPLANRLLREICGRRRMPARTLRRPALALMAALPWRGHGDEMRALLETVVDHTKASSIGVEELLAHVRLDGGPLASVGGGTLRQARARFEREYIGAAIARHQGRISDAARSLGIQRTNLYRKIRALRVTYGGSHSSPKRYTR